MKKQTKQANTQTGDTPHPARRKFIRTATAAGAGWMIVRAESVYGTPANSALGLWIIGCGERGNYVGEEFVRHTDTRIVALMDLFDDRLAATPRRRRNIHRQADGQSGCQSPQQRRTV